QQQQQQWQIEEGVAGEDPADLTVIPNPMHALVAARRGSSNHDSGGEVDDGKERNVNTDVTDETASGHQSGHQFDDPAVAGNGECA
mgnify:CR=1